LNTQQQMFNTQRTQHHRIVKASFDIWWRRIYQRMSGGCCKYNMSWKGKRLREYLFVETYCCPTDRNDGWWYQLYQFTKRVITLTVIIIMGDHCYVFHTKFDRISSS
jgi:hypothetical protein